jgi:peptidoglycan/xylan/chitin deacetylase (PgdA/CDA1 family)
MMHALTLLFHDAVPEGRWDESGFVGADADLYKLECAAFHRHLEAIRRKLKGQFATSPQLLAGTLTNDPCFLLSFDDGGVSAATHIADMLEEFGWRGHFLITAGRVGTAGFLDAAQIRDLHSYSHPLLMAHCSTDQLYEEWHRSALVLSDILGAPITVASVPGGHYSHAVAVAAASAGMKLLFNSEPTTDMHLVDGCLVLGRFCVKRAHAPEWSGRIVAGDFAPKFKEAMLWNIKKVPKIILGDVWLRARQKILEHQAPHPRKRAS